MNKKQILILGLIIAINIFVYYPSFFDSGRGADHQIFLSEMSRIDSLPELISRAYSYPRFSGGDKLLFRPLLYILMSVERFFFGYDFFWWQITGFVLHLLAQGALFRVLAVFVPLRWSTLVVLLSSMLFLQQEMVGRIHYSGYLLFQIFALTACYQFFRYCQDPPQKKRYFVGAIFWLTLASFAYEGALILNGLFVALLFVPWKTAFARFSKRHKGMIFLPLMTYVGVSATDFFCRVKNFSYAQDGLTGSAQPGSFDLGVFLSNIAKMIGIGFQGFLFPAFARVKFVGDQYHYDAFYWGVNNLPRAFNAGLIVFGVGVLFWGFCVAVRNRRAIKSFWDPKVFILGLLILVFVEAYLGLFCLTRLQTNPHYLNTAPHHFYTIYSFALLGLTCVALPFLLYFDRHRVWISRAILIVVLSLSLLQGYFLWQLNRDTRSRFEPQRIYLKELDRFVRQHKNEPDFTFAIFKSEEIHLWNINASQQDQKTLVDMFFAKHLRADRPKYYVVYTKKDGARSFRAGADANQYVQEIIQRNGKWNQDLYIGGAKVDLPSLLLRAKLLEAMKQRQ